MAVALPYFLRAYHSYQLSNAAVQTADIVRLTRSKRFGSTES